MAILICCGASPGLTNVMAADAARDVDTVERIDVCWATGDEGPVPLGRAVLDHAIRGFAGPCWTWENGRAVQHQTFVENDVMALGNAMGDYRLYECAHPESVTLPRRWPEADRIRVLGGLHPAPTNGIMRGVAVAVQEGSISMDEAIDFINEIMTDNNGSAKVWGHALSGLWGTVRRGEISAVEVLKFVAMSAVRKHPPFPRHQLREGDGHARRGACRVGASDPGLWAGYRMDHQWRRSPARPPRRSCCWPSTN